MVRAFAIMTPVLLAVLGGLACRHGGAATARALGRQRARLLLLVIAGFAWSVSTMVLLQAARAVEPAGVTALAGTAIDMGRLGPALLELQWSADALSLAAGAVVLVWSLVTASPALLREGRAAASGGLEPLAFESIGRALLVLAGGWAVVFSHSIPALVLSVALLVLGGGSAETVSRRIPGGWSLVGWVTLAAVTFAPGKPPTMTTLALVAAAGQRSILLRTEVLSGLSYADVATLAVLTGAVGFGLAHRTRGIAALLVAVLFVHLNGLLALSVWGMAALVVVGSGLALAPWLAEVSRERAAGLTGLGLVLACTGMGQFVDAFWVGLSAPLVVLAAAHPRRAWRISGLVAAAAVWGPAWLMATAGASVGSSVLNVVVGITWLASSAGLAARLAEPSSEEGRHTPPGVAVGTALVLLVVVVAARWLGPLTEPIRRLLAVSGQFEGPLALGVLPWAQSWGPAITAALGVGITAAAGALGGWRRPSFGIRIRAASLAHALATITRAALAMAHTLGVEVRNRWWSWRTAAAPTTARRRAVRQAAWSVVAVLVAVASIHRCPSGAVQSETYETPGLAPRLVSPKRPRPLHEPEEAQP